METIVDTVLLAVKNDIVSIDGTLTGILDKSKTKVGKTIVSKIQILTVDEHKIVVDVLTIDDDYNSVEKGGCSLVDEVVATSVINTLSYE